jgi:hypothetical protein
VEGGHIHDRRGELLHLAVVRELNRQFAGYCGCGDDDPAEMR